MPLMDIHSVIEAFKMRGIHLDIRHVSLSRASADSVKFKVRLGRTYNPLPTSEWLTKELGAGKVKKGTLEGAHNLLLGSITLVMESESWASARVVQVRTGRILGSATEYGPAGTAGAKAALAAALGKLRVRFGPATDGRVRGGTRAQ